MKVNWSGANSRYAYHLIEQLSGNRVIYDLPINFVNWYILYQVNMQLINAYIDQYSTNISDIDSLETTMILEIPMQA